MNIEAPTPIAVAPDSGDKAAPPSTQIQVISRQDIPTKSSAVSDLAISIMVLPTYRYSVNLSAHLPVWLVCPTSQKCEEVLSSNAGTSLPDLMP